MFNVSREKLLDEAFFYVRDGTDEVEFVEAWKYSSVDESGEQDYRHGFLEDGEVEDWLNQVGGYAPPAIPHPEAVLEGAIRLIMCHRPSYRPPGFSMSRKSLLLVEDTFRLPKSLMKALFSEGGSFSKHYTYSPCQKVLERIGIVMKVPQKIQVGNYVLALSHELSTGITTALINGYCAMTMRKYITNEIQTFLGDEHSAQSLQIRAQIQATPHLWTHPMLIPTILLDTHMQRAQSFGDKLENQVMELERATGVVFAGRLRGHENMPSKEHTRGGMRKLTKDMHTALSEIIIFSSATSWDVDCALAFQSWCEEIPELIPQHRWQSTIQGSRELAETVRFLVGTSKVMSDYVVTIKERVQSQITVLYSLIAQIDNRLNSKIAVSTGRDSTAMKTLAFITTLFLPGTFIAV